MSGNRYDMVGNLHRESQNSGGGPAQGVGEIQKMPAEIVFYVHGGKNRRLTIKTAKKWK